MPIEHFKILNDDGTTNQAEYQRCIQFLNNYIAGTVKIYPKTTWLNPFEIDMSQKKSAFSMLRNLIMMPENRLLTPDVFNNIKKLFLGLLEHYGSTIHTYGRYLEASKEFKDGPGYAYDVIKDSDIKVLSEKLNDGITVYYLEDDNHTVLEYNDTKYAELVNDETLPTTNYPQLANVSDNNKLESNITNKPYLYHGNISGVYSDFQVLSGQYVGSPTLFYYSQCNDILYTSGANSYKDDRLGEIVNFNYKAKVSQRSIPTQGIKADQVNFYQGQIVNPEEVNAFLNTLTSNSEIKYIDPSFFTAEDMLKWNR